jgi:hypothetical protein
VKIVNKTHYETRDLGKVIRRACKAVGCKGKNLTVTVVYAHRHGYVTGRAQLGKVRYGKLYEGTWMRLRLPFEPAKLRLADLCWVAMHEAQHTIGVDHRGMSTAMMECHTQPLPTWAEGMQVRVKPEPVKDPCSVEERQNLARSAVQKAAAQREARARANLDKWLRAEKHAAVMRKKWAKKVAYYDRKAAAKKCDTNPNKES